MKYQADGIPWCTLENNTELEAARLGSKGTLLLESKLFATHLSVFTDQILSMGYLTFPKEKMLISGDGTETFASQHLDLVPLSITVTNTSEAGDAWATVRWTHR